MKNFFTPLFFTLTIVANTQTTWSDQAAEVFYNNCTSCHHPQGIAPFSLLDYPTAYDFRAAIKVAVENNEMPPWTADSSFQHYFGERLLTQSERDIIINWVDEDGPSGDLATAPPPPVYNGAQILPGTPDLVVTMPNYMSKATTTQDDYACFSVPSGLLQNRKIKAIEIIPGNHAIVHHCLIYVDADGSYLTDSIGLDCGGPTDEPLVGAYTPGSSPTIFPATDNFSAGMSMQANSNIVFAMHYPAGSYGEFDQTKVNIYFYPEPVSDFREIYAAPILQDWSFLIAANTIDTVESVYPDIAGNISMLSVFPHMHLLGKHIESYAITPSNDTIPFVRIPAWDFHWQEFYFFKYMQMIPTGSDIYGMGVYDNTDANHHNPNDPPINVGAGFNTTDEMFMIFFHFMLHQPGDENINIDSLNTIYLSTENYVANAPAVFNVYPNPARDFVNINYSLTESAFVTVMIYDVQGRPVKKLIRENQSSGEHQLIWDGSNENGSKCNSGLYFYSANINGQLYSGQIVLQ